MVQFVTIAEAERVNVVSCDRCRTVNDSAFQPTTGEVTIVTAFAAVRQLPFHQKWPHIYKIHLCVTVDSHVRYKIREKERERDPSPCRIVPFTSVCCTHWKGGKGQQKNMHSSHYLALTIEDDVVMSLLPGPMRLYYTPQFYKVCTLQSAIDSSESHELFWQLNGLNSDFDRA